jgi:hypothetical protein
MKYTFDDGKYTVTSYSGKVTAMRRGEAWRDLSGDKLFLAMIEEIDSLQAQLAAAKVIPKAVAQAVVPLDDLREVYIADDFAGDWHRPFENYVAGFTMGRRGIPDKVTVKDTVKDAAKDAVHEDTKRLDWFSEQGEAYGFESEHHGNRWTIAGAFATLRKAIDDSRKDTNGNSN